jgi:ribosomal RNA-processing protein 36
MSLIKRKSLDAGLQRRVRAQREAIEEVESSDSPSDNGDNPASDDEVNSDAEEFAEEVCIIRLLFELLLTRFPV